MGLVTRRRPFYPGVLPELGHGCEGERLCLCTSVGGFFCNDGGSMFESGGGVVSSIRGSRLSRRSKSITSRERPRSLRRLHSARGVALIRMMRSREGRFIKNE